MPMATKLGRVGTNLNWLLPIKLLNPSGSWSGKITRQTKTIICTTMPMATKLVRGLTYHEGIPTIKSHDPLASWSCKITWQTKNISLAAKLGRMVTYLKLLLLVK